MTRAKPAGLPSSGAQTFRIEPMTYHGVESRGLTAQKRSLPGDEAVYIYSHAASIREDID